MNDRRITRTQKTKASRFARIENAILVDERLSYRARGVAASLLSRPDDWVFSASSLAGAGGNCESGHAIEKAIKELIEYGYIVRARKQDVAGRWTTKLYLFETPTGKNRQSVPTGNLPTVGEPAVLRTTEETNDYRNIEASETSSTSEKRRSGSQELSNSASSKSAPGTRRNPLPLPKDDATVMAEADRQGIPRGTATAFICTQNHNQWRVKGQPIVDWKEALKAWAKTDAKRVTRLDPINNKEFWQWVNQEDLNHGSVNQWIDLMKKTDWKLKNKMTGRLEPVSDLRAVCRAFCESDLSQELERVGTR